MMDLNELADRMYPATAKAQPSEAKTAPQPQAAPAMQPQAAPEPQPETNSEVKPFMAQHSVP